MSKARPRAGAGAGAGGGAGGGGDTLTPTGGGVAHDHDHDRDREYNDGHGEASDGYYSLEESNEDDNDDLHKQVQDQVHVSMLESWGRASTSLPPMTDPGPSAGSPSSGKEKLPSIPPHIYSKFRRERMYNELASQHQHQHQNQMSPQSQRPMPQYAWGDDAGNVGSPGYYADNDEQADNGPLELELREQAADADRFVTHVSTKNNAGGKRKKKVHSGFSGKIGSVESGGQWESPSPVRVDASPSYTSSPVSVSTATATAAAAATPSSGSSSASFSSPESRSTGIGSYSLRSLLGTPSPDKISSPSPTYSHGKAKMGTGSPVSGAGSNGGMYFAFPSTGSVLGAVAGQTPSPLSLSKKKTTVAAAGAVSAGAKAESAIYDSMNTYRANHTRNTDEIMTKKLQSIHEKLVEVNREGSEARVALLASADSMVSKLPLKYLYGKPELRKYAIERAMKPIIKLGVKKLHFALKRALDIWREPPILAVHDEKQVGFLVIATFLGRMLTPIYTHAFLQWAKLYSSRFQKDQDIMLNAAATQIALWYRHTRVTRRKLFQFFTAAVKTCLDRRKAIKHTIQFEMTRRQSLLKFVRAIAKRRRQYFAARHLMRPYLWFKLYRKVQFRLTRKIFARQVQRWFRMTRYRVTKEKYLIGKILYFGGYSVVYPKIPAELLRRNGFLNGFDQCASVIQRSWFVSKGNFAAFMIAAARRAKEEYEQMRNDNALIIQSTFRGHLWNLLTLAAREWNRSRRISFAFRRYQYRCWITKRVDFAKHRPARFIQAWYRKCKFLKGLPPRFLQRKVLFIWQNLKATMASHAIQGAWKAHLERERIKHEEFLKWVAEQRANAKRTAKMVVKIQQNWRQMLKSGNRFPRHVYLVMWRMARKRNKDRFMAALMIQKCARPYIAEQKDLERIGRIQCADDIWGIAKCYLLKLAIWDRVEATKLKKKVASNFIKKNFRVFLLNRHIKIRCILRQHQKKHWKHIYDAASYVQRWIKRKFAEYYIPVRSAARYEVQKKKEREEKRRLLQIRNKAAPFIVKIFRMFKPHRLNIALVERERARILKIHKARCIQKFARKIVAWARFDKIVAYRRKVFEEYERHYSLRHAANVIGYYYKRRNEKAELQSRFVHRKRVLAEYRRLEALRKEAYAARDVAIEDKRRTDENMKATINASWKQGSDVSGKNYYYNYVTGESQWDPPDNWKVPKANKKWLRQIDDRANVYYYNMETQESSWLPPCNLCGEQSEKHCQDCETAYCDRCYDSYHCLDETDDPGDEEQQQLKLHAWSLVEYEKDILKSGDIYCLECKRRCATKMCTTCWDAYCDVCFRYTHHSGNLKYHKAVSYSKAKKGWMCVKATSAGESDYYMKGDTGLTTYEKPWEMMSENERRLYDDFLSHQKASEEHVNTIKELQIKLEEASFERDSILSDAMGAGFMGGSVVGALKKKKTKKQMEDEMLDNASRVDVVGEVEKEIKPGMFDWLTGKTPEYKKKLLKPKERERGNEKSEYMASLIINIEKEAKIAKEEQRKEGMKRN